MTTPAIPPLLKPTDWVWPLLWEFDGGIDVGPADGALVGVFAISIAIIDGPTVNGMMLEGEVVVSNAPQPYLTALD